MCSSGCCKQKSFLLFYNCKVSKKTKKRLGYFLQKVANFLQNSLFIRFLPYFVVNIEGDGDVFCVFPGFLFFSLCLRPVHEKEFFGGSCESSI